MSFFRLLYLFVLLLLSFQAFGAEDPLQTEKDDFKFVPNQQQWESQVLFRADIPGGKLYLQKNALTYVFYDVEKLHAHHEGKATPIDTHNPAIRALPPNENSIRMHALEVQFIDANLNSQVKGVNEFSIPHNFFIGQDPSRWSSGINAVAEVVYEEIYANTDLKLYSSSEGLKYDFILHPGADADNIVLKYNGADDIFLKGKNLVIKTSLQTINEQAPIAYQVIDNKKVMVPCNFVLEGNEVRFAFPQGYKKNFAVIIDPLLIFSTFSGSAADNWGFSATYDDEGNVYTAGIVFNTGFPVTTGAYQEFYSNNLDIGILKFDSTGSNLLYATYLGGSQADVPHSLITNSEGELILLGTTSSANFPVSFDAYQRNFKGGSEVTPLSGIKYANGSDIIISHFSASGNQLLGSTYVGGSKNDGIMPKFETLTKNYGDQFRGDLILDEDNFIYVASHTSSTDFPLVDPFQPQFGGGLRDAIIFKISPNLTDLIWSSYLGGANEDAAYSIKVDAEKNIVVGGGTNSSDFITTPGVIRPSYSGGIDGFVSKIDASGASILYSTFIGTDAYDQVYFVDIDLQSDVYLFGQTLGNYPVSSDVYNNRRASQFIHKINKDFTETAFSTVFGSGSNTINITPNAFLVNECGNIFISGWGGIINSRIDLDNNPTGYLGGSTLNMPLTSDAYQATTDGSDFYLLAFEKDAASLLYATYFGAAGSREHVDGGTSRFDKRGIVYQAVCAGCGRSTGFPTTPGAWSNTNNSNNCNNAVFKFDMATLKAQFVTNNESLDQPGYNSGCAPFTVVFQNTSIGGKDFEWDFGDGTISKQKDGNVHTYGSPGTYKVALTVTDEKTCKKVDYVYGTIQVFKANFFVGSDETICQGESVHLSANGGISYSWIPVESLINPTSESPIASPSVTTTYKVFIVDNNNCTYEDSLVINVIPELVADFSPEVDRGCSPLVVVFENTSKGSLDFEWDFGDGTTSIQTGNIEHIYEVPGTYKVVLKAVNP
ncbi:MAG: PKD domain-containing protein [Bacteroidota bacterium]|nr:PKD domain-containing protein [Bacteroidota bacterium]